MKKFIFGVMLLVSMLGIVGCVNPSDFEDDIYIVKNSTGSGMTISYKNKSGVYVNEKDVPPGGTYGIPASDIKIETIPHPDGYTVTGGYLKVKCNDIETESFVLKVIFEKGVKILNVNQQVLTIDSIEN